MIADWRRQWHTSTNGLTDPQFPFGFVQLNGNGDAPAYNGPADPGDDFSGLFGFAGLRWAQTQTHQRMNNTFMAVVLDTPNPTGGVHSATKLPVGARLAREALAQVYGQKLQTAPLFASISTPTADGKATVTLQDSGVGSDGVVLHNHTGFEVLSAGHWVSCPIIAASGMSVTISGVPKGSSRVRYLWYGNACGLGLFQCAVNVKVSPLKGDLGVGQLDFLPLGPFIADLPTYHLKTDDTSRFTRPADDEVQLEWSNPVLIEDFTYHLVVPDHFFGFDDKHIYGLGFNGSWVFSSDAGRSWRKTHTPGSVPHGLSAMLPITPHTWQSLGGGLFPSGKGSWTLQWPRVYSLLPDGSGFTITVAQGGAGPRHNVSFAGVPYPGINGSAHALIRSGTRNYGVVRAANGKYVLQTDILWNKLPVMDDQMSSIVSFTSADGFAWRYGGVIANWSDVKGNLTDEDNTRNVLNPIRYGPSEIDLTLLSDNRTLLSVVRMDGDDGCFHKTVPPHERDANHTEYRNYAASYSSDHGSSWTSPKPIEGTGCVRPKVKKLDSGVLFLTGGRLCVNNATGIYLWVNIDGMGGYRSNEAGTSIWQRHSITAQHNRLWKGDTKYLFSDMVNDSSVFETLSYTSIVPTGPRSVVITYNKFDYKQIGHEGVSWPGPSANFAISVALKLDDGAKNPGATVKTATPLVEDGAVPLAHKSDDESTPSTQAIGATAGHLKAKFTVVFSTTVWGLCPAGDTVSISLDGGAPTAAIDILSARLTRKLYTM